MTTFFQFFLKEQFNPTRGIRTRVYTSEFDSLDTLDIKVQKKISNYQNQNKNQKNI